MLNEFARIVQEYIAARRRFATATVIRVHGSASAKPGSKAIIDAAGRNVFGWVGGGCAESMVREEALQALAEGRTRIVDVDLDDEVLGVGMPCGGNMQVYIEPHYPARPLLIAGHNRLAQHLAALGALAGYAVTVQAPQARAESFPTAQRVLAGGWHQLAATADTHVVVATDHDGHAPALAAALRGRPAYLGLVARRQVSAAIFKRLRAEGIGDEALASIRTPAGLHLGGSSLEEISLSIVAEMLATDRRKAAYPLRMVKGGHAGLDPAQAPAADAAPGDVAPGGAVTGGAVTGGAAAPPPELLIVGQGRIAEELARLGLILRWPVTVNATGEPSANFPEQVRIVAGDLDFSRMDVHTRTFVVVATLHKSDHLSMERALAGRAPYIGLIASQRRSRLVLDFLRERGHTGAALRNVFAPAGLDLGALTPFEIALSILSEIVGVARGGTCRPLSEVESLPSGGKPDACLQRFE